MTGLDPGIHTDLQQAEALLPEPLIGIMDCRIKPGNDAERECANGSAVA
jgi:hypothetical protein